MTDAAGIYTYTYDWSPRGQLLTEWTQGYPVRAFVYDGAGRMIQARVFTQTTEFVYNGLGARVAVSVEGYGTTLYTLDYAANNRILAETTPTETVSYLYGHDCLGEQRDYEWLYYLNDLTGYVRQGADMAGAIVSAWLFDPDGMVLEGPNGPVSHLICGGVYDWLTGLIYRGGRYFDPNLGIWLALTPLMVVQGWRKRKDKRQWGLLVCVGLFVVGALAGCDNKTREGFVCVDSNLPKASWHLVKNYIPYDYKQDYTDNLISAFEKLQIDFSAKYPKIDWTGIEDKSIERTDDLVDTIKSSRIEWTDIPVYGRADPDERTIKMKSSLLFGPLELSLPVLAHEAHHVYLGSRQYYDDHNVDAERVAHVIQWFVWDQIRPCGQGAPEDEWFLVNYANTEIPFSLNEDEFKNYIIPELRGAYERHEQTWIIANRRLEEAREIIKEWYDF